MMDKRLGMTHMMVLYVMEGSYHSDQDRELEICKGKLRSWSWRRGAGVEGGLPKGCPMTIIQ